MKKQILKFGLYIGLFIVILGLSCNKKETSPEQELQDLYVIDVSQETDWDYWVVGNGGENLFVQVENEKPVLVHYLSSHDVPGYSVFFDERGIPAKLVVEDHVFIFKNFNGSKVDVAVILPDGTLKIQRELDTGIDFTFLMLKSQSSDPSDWLRWTGHAFGAAACIASLAALPVTFGLSVLAAVTCTSTFVGIICEFFPEDYEVLGLSASTIGPIATAIGCYVNLNVACALGTVSTAFSLMSLNQQKLEEYDDEIETLESALESGYGDIQITLRWDNYNDIDLHVIDPNYEEIWWNHKISSSGGMLDRDDIDGIGPENIYWPKNLAPFGTYQVYVNHYSGWDASHYTVIVNAFGKTKTYSGDIYPDETIHIADFDQNGIYDSKKDANMINLSSKEK